MQDASSPCALPNEVRWWGTGLSTLWQGFLGSEGDPATRVEELAALQHRHQDGEQPVGDSAKGSPVGMAAEPCVVLFRSRIALGSDVRPVVDGFAEPRAAGASHVDGSGAAVLALLSGL